MTTTPEQLSKLENEASRAAIEWWQENDSRIGAGRIDAYKAGYLRAKQENEAKQLDGRRIAEAVNNLTFIAREFHAHGSLRQRISGVVVDLVQGLLRDKQETEQAIKNAEKLRTVAINLIAACEEREGDDGERCYLIPAQEFDDLQELLND